MQGKGEYVEKASTGSQFSLTCLLMLKSW